MSLDFDYRNVGTNKAEFDRLTTSPLDATKWHPVGDSLVWMSMICGYNKITTENVDKIWSRINVYQRTKGTVYSFLDGDKTVGLALNRDDVAAYVGLYTNASSMTEKQWTKHLAKLLNDDDGYSRRELTEGSALAWIDARAKAMAATAKAAQ